MHNFLVRSNESACRKSGRLGLDRVKWSLSREERNSRNTFIEVLANRILNYTPASNNNKMTCGYYPKPFK